jgi:hypothetical protein
VQFRSTIHQQTNEQSSRSRSRSDERDESSTQVRSKPPKRSSEEAELLLSLKANHFSQLQREPLFILLIPLHTLYICCGCARGSLLRARRRLFAAPDRSCWEAGTLKVLLLAKKWRTAGRKNARKWLFEELMLGTTARGLVTGALRARVSVGIKKVLQ